MSERRGFLTALLVGSLALAGQFALHRQAITRFDDDVLPGFDAHVYVAMAERPAFFTLPPWGHRVLTPWLVKLVPLASVAHGFLLVTLGALILASGLLYLLLRRFGLGPATSLLGVAAYAFSPPTGTVLSSVFLTDPLALVIELTFLLGLEAGLHTAILAAIAVAGFLDKEIFLLFVPGVFFARRRADGGWRAAASTAIVLAAVMLARGSLRAWAPVLGNDWAMPSHEVFWRAVYWILAGWHRWLAPSWLWLLGPLAVWGATRSAARPFLARYGYLLLLTLVLPFAASVYTADPLGAFFAEDVPRLLLLAFPFLLPLASVALDGLWPSLGLDPARISAPQAVGSTSPSRRMRWQGGVAAASAGLLALLPWLVGDRYQREDLRGPRDGRLVLALCRDSLAFARRLDRGRVVRYEIAARRFSPPRTDPHLLERMRWFLREGWGERPHLTTGPVVMKDREAVVLLPCLRPALLELTLVLSAPAQSRVGVQVNATTVGEVTADSTPTSFQVLLPERALVRGDNRIRLVDPARSGVRLHEVSVKRVPARSIQ